MTLGTRLSNYRTKRNLSLEQLAYHLQISKTAVGKWEADKSKPSIDNLMKICNYYETDVYTLLENVDNINFCKTDLKVSCYSDNAKNFIINNETFPQLINIFELNQKTIIELIQVQNDLISKLIEKNK